jgi:hypothetical protein
MRIVSTIDRPLRDEHVLAVDPPLRPELPDVWRRRINPFGGRALSAAALAAEQEVRSGVQLLRGQSVTAGIVSGLDLLLEPNATTAAPGDAVVQILPGFGLTHSGEDITVASPRRLALGDLPIYARVDRLDAAGIPPAAADPLHDVVDGGAFARLPPLRPRRLGPPLRDAIAAHVDLPRVAILVAEPVTAEIVGRGDPASPCPRDPRDDPYDDWQRIDGCRLTLAFWPDELVAGGLPDYALPASGPSFRNRLAYAIFTVERAFQAGEAHPWESVGVPIGLVAFKDDWTLDFIDRAAVVRLGGRPKPRTALVANAGSSLLWQARVSQFVEHLSALADLTSATLAATLRHLPPVGLLPRDVIDLATRRQTFFPTGFTLSAAPAPLEHLDLVVGESASLDPILLDVADEVELLVPVPERVYEPGLLEIAVVDPQFASSIGRFVADRTQWLTRRELVRRRRDVLADAVSGLRPGWRADDTTAAELLPEPTRRAPATCTRVRRNATAGSFVHGFTGAASSLEITAGDRIAQWVRIANPTGLTGFALMLNERPPGGTSVDFPYRAFWGVPPAGDTPADLRRQGALPPAGAWTRLEASADATWRMVDGASVALAGHRFNGVSFRQGGGIVEWGPLSKVDAAGNETLFVADDAPAGATLQSGTGPGWPWAAAGPGDLPIEADFGTASPDGARRAAAIDALRGRWPQPFLADDFQDLTETGADGFAATIDAKLRATNDAIDLGFVRARADIYRVRQYMLGADTASRLVTSPSLADVSIREESARARSDKIQEFVQAARAAAVPPPPSAPPPSSPASSSPTGGLHFAQMFANVSLARPGITTPTRRTAASEAVLARGITQTTTAAPTMTVGGFAQSAVFTVAQPATAFVVPSVSSLALAARFERDVSVRDVQAQQPLVGFVERTVSVAERLQDPAAVEAHRYALAGKLAVRDSLAKLIRLDGTRREGIALADLPALGYTLHSGVSDSGRTLNTFGDLIGHSGDYDDDAILGSTTGLHESDYFAAAVKALDNTVGMMRLVEGRIALYNRLLVDARSVHDELSVGIGEADARLRVIATELEEARHDVGVAQALLAEEQARVDALNAKRAAILDAHVKAVLFRRPRVADRAALAPTSPASAALVEVPAAACLRSHPAAPEELRAFASAFREAPVRWFPALHPRLQLIDRLDAARAAVTAVRLRAETTVTAVVTTPVGAPKFVAAVGAAFAAQRVAFEPRRLAALQLDLSKVLNVGIVAARQQLIDTASLGDLIDAAHGRPELGRHAAAELDAIAQVATCLHDGFGETPPIVRLEWAEALSEFDQPAPLRSLAGLPRWGELPLELRRKQQGLVDWLFSRIDRNIAAAEAAMNELVRVCLLMAAHAPVDRIVPARLITPVPVRPGNRLDLALDASVARIGMTVLARGSDDRLLARAVIEDVSEGTARARITHAIDATATLTSAAHVHLTDTA